MHDTADRPQLRPVEAIPATNEGKQVVILRDPEGFSEQPFVLSERAAFLATFMDGSHTLLDMQAAYARRFGDLLFTRDLEDLVRRLDEASLLDSASFREKRAAADRAWREATVRPAVHLSAFDADRETWLRWIEGFFASAGEPETPPPPGTIRGLVVPHIDLRIGGPTYAAGWNLVKGAEPPSVVVVFGTCHSPLDTLITATTKDFETPLGTVPTDVDLLREVDREAGGLFDEEPAHRREHTIEFQALFVRALFDARRTKIAPILASYSPLHLAPDASPSARTRIDAFCRVLASRLAEREGRALLVASADLSHVGPRYGDRSAPTDAGKLRLERSDRALLETVLALDGDALTRRMRETEDRTRVCGYAPIHALLTVLALLGGAKGSLLRYAQGTMGEDGSIVSFASIAFGSSSQPTADRNR